MTTIIPLALFSLLAVAYAIFAFRDYRQEGQWTVRGKLQRRMAIIFACVAILQLVLAAT